MTPAMQPITSVFARRESEVRSYCRSFPAVFKRAKGVRLFDDTGRSYLDLLGGAGTMNYGHNHDRLVAAVVSYLQSDGLIHGLDLHTEAKAEFLQTFETHLLHPRGLTYKVQFTGPTGTNAVEAALKLARKVTGRSNIVSFTNGYHGLTLGGLAATANRYYRQVAGAPLGGAMFMPFDGYLGEGVDTIDLFRRYLEDPSSGLDLPAAVILETVQGEGGINVASPAWLQRLAALCKTHQILLIVDDIQAGCGRTGTFFSFEESGIVPDLVTLSKSLGAIGLPMSVVLIKPEYDIWQPGEHTGTFRGNNLAFVAATAAIRHWWASDEFAADVRKKGAYVRERLREISVRVPNATVRGKGLMNGIDCANGILAKRVSAESFARGLIIETCGGDDQVVKLLPPLIITMEEIDEALSILSAAIDAALIPVEAA